jgi:uncharacterized protein YdeI (YjbR/CyaY-like superfamily)
MANAADLPMLPFRSRAAFVTWMGKNHQAAAGLWVKFAKKASGIASITYEEAREVAITYGWIDGLKHGVDDTWYALRFTPRRRASRWSKINRGIAEQLIEAGTMHAAGIEQVEAARADGRWDEAYPSQRSMEIPPELARALKRSKTARDAFATISRANRYAILHRLHHAKKQETRERLVATFVEMLARGEVPHPDR